MKLALRQIRYYFFWKCPLTCNFVGGCTFSLKMLMLWAGGTMLLGGSSVDIDRWDISTPSQRDGVDNVDMQYVTICAGQVRISVSREESGPSGALVCVLIARIEMRRRRNRRPACVNVDA